MEEINQAVHLDDPKYFLIFTMEDFGICIGCMGIGIILHALGYMVLIGVGASYVMSRFRGSLPEGRLQHLLYWHGVPVGKGHSLINPYARKFVG